MCYNIQFSIFSYFIIRQIFGSSEIWSDTPSLPSAGRKPNERIAHGNAMGMGT